MENDIFKQLLDTISDMATKMKSIADKVDQLQPGGGGGSASIADYQPNQKYKRNTLLVDPTTETVYRVLISEYMSVTVESDLLNGYIKLVGFEGQVVTFNHNPTEEEIGALPDDSLVAVYSSTDTPYIPDQS